MRYSAVYCALISKRLKNPISKKDCYCERHHIIPKSEGGTDESDNLVNLTAREHYIAHLLLAKIYDDWKMTNAIFRMQTGIHKAGYKVTSRLFESVRKSLSQKQSVRVRGASNPMWGRCGSLNPFYGKKHNPEKMKHVWEKFKETFKGERNPMFGKRGKEAPCFGRTGEKHPMFGKHHSEEVKKRISKSLRERSRQHPELNFRYGVKFKGTIWITDGKNNLRIGKGEPIPESFHRGRVLKNG